MSSAARSAAEGVRVRVPSWSSLSMPVLFPSIAWRTYDYRLHGCNTWDAYKESVSLQDFEKIQSKIQKYRLVAAADCNDLLDQGKIITASSQELETTRRAAALVGSISARFINVSRTGVAVELGASGIVPGHITLVGTRPVTPGRRIALGMVLLFVKPLDPKLCGPDIIL